MMRHLMSWWKKQVEVIRLLALCLKVPHLHQLHLHKGIISHLKCFILIYGPNSNVIIYWLILHWNLYYISSELKAKAESIRTKIILGDVDSTPQNENSYPSPLSDDREQTSKGNYISKEELINDINDMLKLKINGKIVQKLDLESLKKLSKGKLTEILKEAQGDKSLMEKASNIHEGLKNLRFKHHAEDDNGDQLESDEADYNDGSTDYDDDLDEDE